MVLAFTEKQKNYIESRGISVIEFKRIAYKITDWAKNAVEAVIELFRKIAEPLTDVLKEFSEKISSVLEDIKDWYFNLPETERHKIVKYYAKANNPSKIQNRNKVYHCRNNC